MLSKKRREYILVFHYVVTHRDDPDDRHRDDPDDTDTETQTDRLSLTVGSFVWSRL